MLSFVLVSQGPFVVMDKLMEHMANLVLPPGKIAVESSPHRKKIILHV
jgi:hypothetical protein